MKTSLKKTLLRRMTARLRRGAPLALIALSTVMGGCRWGRDSVLHDHWRHYQQTATQIEFADAKLIQDTAIHGSPDPNTVRATQHREFWDLRLEDAVQIALENSEVMRDIGGRVVSAPDFSRSIYDPAIAESSALTGVEAALSQFDAQFNSSLIFTRDELSPNNPFFSGQAGGGLKTTNATLDTSISKTSAAGTRFRIGNVTQRNDTSATQISLYPSYYQTDFVAGFQHPLLQGGGIEFNRIAGPNAQPGVYNGVLLARINTDVAIADFELGVRDLVRDVEQAYWDLHFSYRDLDARRIARDAALELWRYAEERRAAGVGDPADAAVALSQFYASQAQVEENLGGSLTLNANGLYDLERRLRLLMGLPATDDRLIRPVEEPTSVEVKFDWRDSLAQSFFRRAELRRQQWQIKRRELELVASRNFRLARLDFIGEYTWRGFGDKLLSSGDSPNPTQSAFQNLTDGSLQGWQTGLLLSTPIGNRIGHTAVRNAELQLARERAVYREQERAVSYELADAFSDLDRAYIVARTNYNRRDAAQRELEIKTLRWREGAEAINFVLDALQRLTLADIAYHRARADYSLALMQIHVARGTLLDLHGVQLAEGPWTPAAHEAALKEARRFGPYLGEGCIEEPCPISKGPAPEFIAPGEVIPGDVVAPEAVVVPPGSAPIEDAPLPPSAPAPQGIEPPAPPGATGLFDYDAP